jgi:Barstar (barnase inhibitor)
VTPQSTPTWLQLWTATAPAGAIVLDGAACRTRDALFAEFARALRFPAYFGRNWDALADCLREMAPAVLYVRNATGLLRDEPPSQFTTLLDILGTQPGLTVLLGATAQEAEGLRRRLLFR